MTGPQRTEREVLRLLLANDAGIRSYELSSNLFSVPEHRNAFEIIMPVIDSIEQGAVADLGAAIGSDDRTEAALLRSLAMVQRPLADADDVMKRLKQEAVERRIEQVQAELVALDGGADPQAYSDLLEGLIALQKV